MNTLWLIIIFGLIFIITWFTRGFMSARHTDTNRRRKMARNRTQPPPSSEESDIELTISFPNPATSSLDRIIAYLESENSLIVLQRYIEVARKYQAQYKILRLIEKRITQLEKESTKPDSITFMDYLFSKFRL